MQTLTLSPTQDYLLKDGKSFFYLADTVWAAFANLSIETWRDYLAYRRAQGFSAVQISILPITHDTSTSPDNDQPFLPDAEGHWDFYRLNVAYFDKALRMVEMAAQAGILPILGVVWKCHVPGTRASERSPVPSAMPKDAMLAYAEYAVRRFAPHTPAFFISGDTAWDSDQEPVITKSGATHGKPAKRRTCEGSAFYRGGLAIVAPVGPAASRRRVDGSPVLGAI